MQFNDFDRDPIAMELSLEQGDESLQHPKCEAAVVFKQTKKFKPLSMTIGPIRLFLSFYLRARRLPWRFLFTVLFHNFSFEHFVII